MSKIQNIDPEITDARNAESGAIFVSPEHANPHLTRQHFPRAVVPRDKAIPALLEADDAERALNAEILERQAKLATIKDAAIQRQESWEALNAARDVLASTIQKLESRLNHYQGQHDTAARELVFYLGTGSGVHEETQRFESLCATINTAKAILELAPARLAEVENLLEEKEKEIVTFRQTHGIQS